MPIVNCILIKTYDDFEIAYGDTYDECLDRFMEVAPPDFMSDVMNSDSKGLWYIQVEYDTKITRAKIGYSEGDNYSGDNWDSTLSDAIIDIINEKYNAKLERHTFIFPDMTLDEDDNPGIIVRFGLLKDDNNYSYFESFYGDSYIENEEFEDDSISDEYMEGYDDDEEYIDMDGDDFTDDDY